MKIDLQAVDKMIAEVADQEIMPRFRKLADGDVEMKGVNDPVTVADKAAEAALTKLLCDAYPGSVVVGEESFAADPQILSHFAGENDVWVIDPIDGTRNFIAGSPEFGVMVALMRRGKTIAAWIHDPNTKQTIMAEQGGGVWLRGHKMRLAESEPALCLVGSRMKKIINAPQFDAARASLPPYELGGAAAFDYSRLFTGDVLFADSKAARVAYLAYMFAKPWDHLPGLFLHEEAGGYSADLAGNPYQPQEAGQGLLSAPNQEQWHKIAADLHPLLEYASQKRESILKQG